MSENAFSLRLKELRAKKGISQYKMAESLGLSRSMISNYEQGTREPDYTTLKQLARYFNVSIDYLLGESDIKHPLNQDEIQRIFEILKQIDNIDDLNADKLAKLMQIAKDYAGLLDSLEALSQTSLSELENYIELLKMRDTLDNKKETTSSALKNLG